MQTCRQTVLSAFSLLIGIGVAGYFPINDLRADEPQTLEQTGGRELHTVGIYEGFTKTNGKIHGGKARVTVNRPGKLVTLVLVSNDPVTWQLTVGKDTRLEKVILGGNDFAAATGMAANVQIVKAYRGSARPVLAFSGYDRNSPSFHRLIEAIDAMTGQKIASFSGRYRAATDQPFIVDSVQRDERLSPDYPRPAPAATLPKLSFSANQYVSGRRPFDESRSFGEFTLGGPRPDTFKPLPPRVDRIIYDPIRKKHYGISDHGIVLIDMEKRTVNKIKLSLEVPKMNWPADITFDTKRNRILVSTSTNGYLFAYYPEQHKWAVLRDNLDSPVLTYHAKDDSLYSIAGNGSGELRRLNQNGAVVKTMKLDGPFLPGLFNLGPGVTGAQMVSVDDKLVLLLSPLGRSPGESAICKWSYIYLVDPKTGKAQLTWKGK